MSPLTIASTLFSLVQSSTATSSGQAGKSAGSATSTGTDFASSLTLRMAALQAQSFNSLLDVASGQANASASSLDWLTGASSTQAGSGDPLLGSSGTALSASGYNMSLFDPQSAYTMMSIINSQDVSYKAQFSELSDMKTAVAGLQDAGQTLSKLSAATDNEAIKTQLQTFTAKYNDWITRFDGTVKSGGVLAGTQAAEISLYELEQSVENPFNGASDGFHGLADLGLSIDESTNLATLDTTALDAALSSNKDGAVNTLQEFAVHFAKSAELLNSPNNFIPNRLDNLDRVIDYVADNKSSLQAEFGLGAAAKPSAQVAKALAAYNKTVSS
ncbi:MAG: hypothetical protein H6R17_3225 [Proteobacteria bacterium]|nr:hypothetical protein [Pseudomonadota bacterium]